MLNLTRGRNETVVITAPDGAEIRVTVCYVRGDRVRLGIAAPRNYIIDREEIHERKKRKAVDMEVNGNVAEVEP